ncbi:hypothetical protein [Flavobacterium sp.]|uniref:hypothetical protein n=1 Tax=Flavobacterium sp. TaxID=239 RepID=UPI00262C771B|nr:hypothetical protein [Flavobacterium sp.]
MKIKFTIVALLAYFFISAQHKIQPNGKVELNKALPKKLGGYVLMLREQHDQPSHLKYFDEHLEELKFEHSLQTIGLELPPFMMMLFWNYSDAPDDSKEKANARKVIEDLHSYDFEDEWQYKKSLILHALDLKINIICMDSRYPYYEYANLPTEELKKEYYTYRDINADTKIDSILQKVWELEKQYQVQKVYDEHKKYRKRIDKIDEMINAMNKDRLISYKTPIENDVITATIFTSLADSTKNALIIYGGGHMDGLINDTVIYKAQGILDESIATNKWKVTDGIANNASEIESRYIGKHKEYCKFDHIDFVWAIDLDIIAHPPIIPDSSIKNPPLGLNYDIFSCIEGQKVDYSFCPERLNPQLDLELNKKIQELKKTFK